MLRIFTPEKIRRLRPGLNPQTWVPEASMLPGDKVVEAWWWQHVPFQCRGQERVELCLYPPSGSVQACNGTALPFVHTCNVTTYRNAVTLQMTDTIRSYNLNFHPVPHDVTVSCERYTVGFPVCYGSQTDAFAASSGFGHLYTLDIKEKEKRVAVVAQATVHKQGSAQRFRFGGLRG
jgi:hypothetical protein